MKKEEEKKERPSYDQLVKKLAEQTTIAVMAKLDSERNRSTIDSLTKENEQLRKQIRQQKKTIEQAAHDERQAREVADGEFQKIKKELEAVKIENRYISQIGMDEITAKKAAEAEISGDMEAWQSIMSAHIEKVKMTAEQEAMQEFLVNRPEIRGGNGDIDRNATAVSMAAAYASRNSGVDMNVLNQYM